SSGSSQPGGLGRAAGSVRDHPAHQGRFALMTQVMAAGQSRTWRIPVVGDAQVAASLFLDRTLRFPGIQVGKRTFHVSACPELAAGIIKERGSIECRLDAASQSEAETIQIIVEKASIDALSSDGADETVALIIAIGANPTSGLSGDDDSRLPAMLRRLAETRQ